MVFTRITSVAFLICFFVIYLSSCQTEKNIHSVNLDKDTFSLNWQFERRTMLDLPNSYDTPTVNGSGIERFEFDGDPWDECVILRGSRLFVNNWSSLQLFKGEVNRFSPRSDWLWAEPFGDLFTDFDLEGDGRDEVVLTVHSADYRQFEMFIWDPIIDEFEGHIKIAGGSNPDTLSNWQGWFRPIGDIVVPREDGSTIRALLTVGEVWESLDGRGLRAYDPLTGNLIWELQTGGAISSSRSQVADVDNDGFEEIILTTSASEQPAIQQVVNGTSPNQTSVQLVDNQGQVVWTRHLAGVNHRGYSVVNDFDHDGQKEIVVNVYSTRNLAGYLYLLDGPTGEVLDKITFDSSPKSIRAVPTGTDDGLSLVLGFRPHGIRQFVVNGDLKFVLTAEAATKDRTFLYDVSDVLPLPGSEFLARVANHGVFLLDSQLNPCAFFPEDQFRVNDQAKILRVAEDRCFLLSPSDQYGCLELVQASFWAEHGEMTTTAGLVLSTVLATLLIVLLINRRRKKILAPIDLQLMLLNDLELANHGGMSPSRSLRRLAWNLNGLVTLNSNSPELVANIESIASVCLDYDIPRLQGILDLAEMSAVDGAIIESTRSAISSVRSLLAEICHDSDALGKPENLAHRATVNSAELDGVLFSMRSFVESSFETNAVEVWQRVLDTHQERIKKMNFVPEAIWPQQEIPIKVDTNGFHFVLDNLVDNSLQAMKGIEKPALVLRCEEKDGNYIFLISDEGLGIAEEDWERVMEPGFSTRNGGGLGLSKSREIIHRFGGQLTVKDSAPGRGSIFRIALAACRLSGL